MNKAEFDQVVEEARAKHGRIDGWHDDDFGAILVRAPTRDELGKYAADSIAAAGDDFDARESVIRACIVTHQGADLDELLDELPALIERGAERAIELAGPDRKLTDEELSPHRSKARRIAGWHIDGLGSFVFRSPKKIPLRRYEQELKAPKGDIIAASEALLLDCVLAPDADSLPAAFDKRPGFAVMAAALLKELAGASGRALGKALA